MIGPLSISNLPAIKFGGVWRVLGWIPETPESRSRFPKFKSSFFGNPVLDPSGWIEQDLSWYKAPILDQGMTSSCFPPGTRIRMKDGSEKHIENIKLLDQVLTAEGNIGTVTHLFVKKEEFSVVKLHLFGHRHLSMTEEHPVLTSRGYIEASKLTLDDWVAMPRYMPETNKFIQAREYISSSQRRTVGGRRTFHGLPGKKITTVVRHSVPDIIYLTKSVGRIFGLFLAEGNTTRHTVAWTFGYKEKDTLVAELVGLLEDEWGLECNVSVRGHSSIRVTIHGGEWAKLFEILFSTGAGNKRIHPDVISGPSDFIESIWKGWIDGDGYERRNTVQGTTISRELALAMYDIAQFLGMRPSIRRSEQKATHGIKYRHPKWEVIIGTVGNDTYRCKMDDKHVWRKVRGIVKEDYNGPVYNFEVDGDNSYVAEGIGVHNCTAHACTTGMETCWMQSGRELLEFNQYFLYALINGGRDAGSMISDALTALQQYGICLKGDMPLQLAFQNQIPQGAYNSASSHKLIRAYHCGTFEEICSAISLGFCCPLGIYVGDNFAQLDSEGVAPLPNGGGGGHAICGLGLKKSARYGWLIKIQNSWSSNFGLSGYCYLRKEHFNTMPPDAFAIQEVSSSTEDTIPVVVS